MQPITPIATDHQLILQALDVMRLIANRVQAGEFVEPDDITTLLGFLRDVGCECLGNTEHLLLRPALMRAKRNEQVRCLRTAVACHETIGPLFEDLLSDVTFQEHFVLHSHLFTKLVSDLIFEEDQSLLQTAVDLLDDPEGRRNLETFTERERYIRTIALEGSPKLHWLETKYADPHCI